MYKILLFLLKINLILLIILTTFKYIKSNELNFKVDNILINKSKLYDPINKLIIIMIITSFILHIIISIY